MNLSLQTRYKKISAVLVLLIVIFLLIQSAFNTWLAYSYAQGPQPNGLLLASEIEPENPDYYFLTGYYLAEYEYLSSRDTALEEYKKAISLSPFNYNYWFHLAEIFYEGGMEDKAVYALNMATSLSPGSVALRWRAGMLASKLGDSGLVLENLSPVIKYDRVRRQKAFVLLWQSVGEEDRIIDAISNNALPQYFYYLRLTDRIDEAGRVFEKMKKLGYDTSIAAKKYASDLIRKGDIESAVKVWRDEYGDWEGLWNYGFEEDMKNDGFDWKIGRQSGIKVNKDMEPRSGKYSAKVEFEETDKTNFSSLYQFIPVDGSTGYKIGLYLKAEDIVTSEKLHWQVYCLNDEQLDARSEPIRGSHDWKLYTITFTTPKDCNAINLRLTRENTNKVNKTMSGTLWVDDVSIVERPVFH